MKTSHNPRSTVGTVTEIHDYLRLLCARAGTPHCPDHVLALPEDTKLMILAPVVVKRNRTKFYRLLDRHQIDPALFK